jgi:hypothetical protein
MKGSLSGARVAGLVLLFGCSAGTRGSVADADASAATTRQDGGEAGAGGTAGRDAAGAATSDAAAGSTGGSTGGSSGAGGDQQTSACNGKVSGGAEDTFDFCAIIIDTNVSATQTEVVTGSAPAGDKFQWKGFDLVYSGMPHTGAIDPASIKQMFTAFDDLVTGERPTWAAGIDQDGTTFGSWSLTFSSLGSPYVNTITGEEEFNDSHGTLTATLVYRGSGTKRPDVQLRVDF